MRQSDHRFVCEAPRYHPDEYLDPFYDSEGMASLESERCWSGEWLSPARVGHAAGSRSSNGSDIIPPAYRDALPLSQRTPSGKSTFVSSLSERDPDSFRKGAY